MVVVVHVHERVLATALGEELDQIPHHSLLLFESVGPALVVGPLAICRTQVEPTQKEQIVLGGPEWMTLEVKEYVSFIRRREELKPVTEDRVLPRFYEFERRRFVGPLA